MRLLILLFLILSTLYPKYLPNRVSNSVTGAIGYIHFQKESITHDDMCIDLSYNISNYIIGLKNSGSYSTTNYIYDSYYIGYYVNNWEFDLGKAIISGFNCNGNKEIKYVDLSNVTFHLTAVF